MFEELGFDVYVGRMQVAEEQEEDPSMIEAEEQRMEFYAVIEQARKHWFELEATFRRTGDPAPLHNLISQIREAAVPRADPQVDQAE